MNLEVVSVILLTLIGSIAFRIVSNQKLGKKQPKVRKETKTAKRIFPQIHILCGRKYVSS